MFIKLFDILIYTNNSGAWEVESAKSGLQGHAQIHSEFETSLDQYNHVSQTDNTALRSKGDHIECSSQLCL